MKKKLDNNIMSQARSNIFSCLQGTFIIDPKDDLWVMTANWRQNDIKNKVLRLVTTSSNASICWNPLDEINRHD